MKVSVLPNGTPVICPYGRREFRWLASQPVEGASIQEKGGFPLPLQFADGPSLSDALLLVKAALQMVFDLQKLHDVGPAQLVRQRRTCWELWRTASDSTSIPNPLPILSKTPFRRSSFSSLRSPPKFPIPCFFRSILIRYCLIGVPIRHRDGLIKSKKNQPSAPLALVYLIENAISHSVSSCFISN